MAFSLDLLINIESVGCLLKLSWLVPCFVLSFLLNSAVSHIKIKEHRSQINMPTGAFSDIFGTFLFICAQ